MGNIYDTIGHTSRKHHFKLKKLLEPLTLFCGVDRFWRNVHDIKGSYSLLGNYPATAEVFFEQDLYKGHPYFRHPDFFRSGFVIPGLCKNKEYETTQGKFDDCLQILLFIRKHTKGFIEYGFATSTFRPGFEMTYLNHLNVFKKFIDYFDAEGEKIIQESLDHQINISEIIGKQYYVRPEITGDTIVPQNELQFLTAIETNPERAKSIFTLTKSERVAIGRYLAGGTVKQIAQKLHVSPRTLEKHLENAKGKLGVSTRSELFEALIPYQEFFSHS